jgi:hypothetical protein
VRKLRISVTPEPEDEESRPEELLILAIINRALDDVRGYNRAEPNADRIRLRAQIWFLEAEMGIDEPQSLRWYLSLAYDDVETYLKPILEQAKAPRDPDYKRRHIWRRKSA